MIDIRIFLLAALSLILTFGSSAHAKLLSGKYFDRVIFVIFENTDYAEAAKQPYFKQLNESGAHFSNMTALTHPSQGNYVALTSGSLNGVDGDGKFDLAVGNIADLLEAKGLTWKVYAEGFPGNCFTGSASGGYARKHNPFISYVSIQSSRSRCSNIVEASQFDRDAANGTLPNYSFYVPNNKNSGHDTSVAYADKWYKGKFSPYVSDARFMNNTILISTFDESGKFFGKNQIYTSIVGATVKSGIYNDPLTLYSLMRLVEQNWNTGDLGKQDATANPVPDIWR